VRTTPERLGRLVRGLRGDALRALPSEALLAAWAETVAAFLDPHSPERLALDPALARLSRLSPEGLAAALDAVLGGARREPASALLAEAEERERPSGSVLIVLASNLPALAVQPLLPALALRRPVLLKSPSAEPVFVPAFLEALVRREPRLADALAAASWPGGDAELEAPVLEAVETVIAYGDEPALADLERRAPGKVVGYGPKTSLAVVGPDADLGAIAAGLARDIALFDQRGCLSVAAVYVAGTAGDAAELAERLALELKERARAWPSGPILAAEASAVQQARLEAEMRGLRAPRLTLAQGTVIVETEPAFRPSPGLRTVRVHPLADLDRLPDLLAPWRGRLQGAALVGLAEDTSQRLTSRLAELGISRFALPGELQSPDVAWHNGGIHPLVALGKKEKRREGGEG
jgi:hypothetical protein